MNQNYLLTSFKYDLHAKIKWAVSVCCRINCSALCLTSPQDGGTWGSITCGDQLASRLQRGPRSAPWGALRSEAGKEGGLIQTSSLFIHLLTGGTSPAPPCGLHHMLHPPLDLEQSPDGKSQRERHDLEENRVDVWVKSYVIVLCTLWFDYVCNIEKQDLQILLQCLEERESCGNVSLKNLYRGFF